MNQELECTCAQPLLCSLNILFGDVRISRCRCRRGLRKSLLYLCLRWFYKAYLPFLEQKILLNSSEGRSPGGLSLNGLKKNVIEAAGKETVVLAAKGEKQGQCVNRVMNFSELSCISCARQVVCVVYICTLRASRCNEPLEKLVHSPNHCTTATNRPL